MFLSEVLIGVAPWIVIAAIMLWRTRGTRHLDSHAAYVQAEGAPLLSVIVPARNEEHNIERCVGSLLESGYPRLQVVIVDDHSDDRTGELARSFAARDARVVVTTPPPLPEGWFGKSWACQHGASVASGELLLFTDADTWHHPELHSRLRNALSDRSADMISIGGAQEAHTFWEKLVQPLIFLLLLFRYGGTEEVNRSPNPRNKIANGQCIFTTRAAYNGVGGHASVRATVAEDLKLAQVYAAAGKRVILEVGLPFISTRMYRSLGEVVEGWGKNIYAGSLLTMPQGWIFRAVLLPLLLALPPLLALALPVLLLLCLAGVADMSCVPLLATNIAMLVLGSAMFLVFRISPLYALAFPIGAAILLYIVMSASLRGSRVRWKGRSYTSE